MQSVGMPDGSGISACLSCSSCGAIVGVLDDATNSYKLSKLALSISQKSGHSQSFDATKWLSCYLLNSMDSQGLRKFVVTSRPQSQQPLLIWLFAPDLNIASSAASHDAPMRVAKILWKLAPEQSQDGRLNEQSMSEGEIEVPEFELEALRQSLERSVKLLPESAYKFQDWNVALLERFAASDAVLQ